MCRVQQSLLPLGIDRLSAGSFLHLGDARPQSVICNRDQSPGPSVGGRGGTGVCCPRCELCLSLARSCLPGTPPRQPAGEAEQVEDSQRKAADWGW